MENERGKEPEPPQQQESGSSGGGQQQTDSGKPLTGRGDGVDWGERGNKISQSEHKQERTQD